MNRRATLSKLLGKNRTSQEQSTCNVASIAPFTGTFDEAAASHLLSRVIVAPTYQQIKQAVSDGLAATLEKVFTTNPVTANDQPLNYGYDADPNCTIGESWIDRAYSFEDEIRQYRVQSMFAWTGLRLLADTISIEEKLVLFWHNHFVTSDIDDPKFTYHYSKTLRDNALGNFREFTKAITVDPSMLIYLNGNENINTSPNENFARELVELFTVGKGDLVGPGDYTNYTEDDIKEMAKILTGWKVLNYFSLENGMLPESQLFPQFHDNSVKQLSHRFGNATISGAGGNEYINLINVIFGQAACARHICTKFYRFFVSDSIDENIEQNVIEPLAQLMIAEDYEIQPVLEALFASEHFFSEAAYGCSIKNPVDYVFGFMRQFELPLSDDLTERYVQARSIMYAAGFLGMEYYRPPSVAGWKAYYQAPTFHQVWINSVTLPTRMAYIYGAINQGVNFNGDAPSIDFNPLKIVSQMTSPFDPNALIEEFALLLLPRPISVGQRDYLKAVLIPGLPDFEWSVEYSEYAADPDNESLAIPVRSKINAMLSVMTTLGEYQLV